MFYAILSPLVLLTFLAAAVQAQHGVVKGKVKEQGGKALEGVTVRAVNEADKKNRRETKTDSKGEFEFSGLAAGAYVLSFEQPGFRTFVTRQLEVKDGETIRLSRVIELARERDPYALLRGAVFTDAGFSLPHATVTIERLGGGKRFKQEKTSGEDGSFAFRLPADKATYRVTASARGFQPLSKEVTVDSDEVRQVALALARVK
jgi:uncharacterized surface anchored protein